MAHEVVDLEMPVWVPNEKKAQQIESSVNKNAKDKSKDEEEEEDDVE